jgi:non-ribosomal peptide synthetase component E (peptide arylation enzyme)
VAVAAAERVSCVAAPENASVGRIDKKALRQRYAS